MTVRINKYISESGYCSRREADKYIEQGAVTINGKKAEMGSQVLPGQEVRVFGELISNDVKPVIIAYNKPVGVVSTTDPKERNNMVDAIGHTERIFPIGRLDKDSQGLILLTNQGDIVNKILRVNNNHDKEYFVVVNKPINAEFIRRMENGVPILGVVTRKCELKQRGECSFNIVLRQGLNRQIRRMCEYLGYTVTKLQRVRIMHIHLGDLKMGQYRNLTPEESDTLYKKIANSVKTEEASTGKKRPSTAMPGKPKPANNSKRNERGGGNGAKSSKPSGRNTSYKPKGKSTRRTGGR